MHHTHVSYNFHTISTSTILKLVMPKRRMTEMRYIREYLTSRHLSILGRDISNAVEQNYRGAFLVRIQLDKYFSCCIISTIQ